jgi:hypothetical protein
MYEFTINLHKIVQKKNYIKSSIQTIKVKTGSNLNYCGGFVFVMEGTRKRQKNTRQN